MALLLPQSWSLHLLVEGASGRAEQSYAHRQTAEQGGYVGGPGAELLSMCSPNFLSLSRLSHHHRTKMQQRIVRGVIAECPCDRLIEFGVDVNAFGELYQLVAANRSCVESELYSIQSLKRSGVNQSAKEFF